MKILTLHCDFIRFKPLKKAVREPDKITKAEKKGKEIKECLVIFTAIEKSDEKDVKKIIHKLIENIKDISKQVGCRKILLYPYAHLSLNLASPSMGSKILNQSYKAMKKIKNLKIEKAPFGYYKEFELKCKGHPLSELSREISIEDIGKKETKAIISESKLKSEWYILDEKGILKRIKLDKKKIRGFNFSSYKNLEKFALYEMAKSKIDKDIPPHVKLMKRLELVDYESASDPGNFRFYPKGFLIKSLIEDYISKKMNEYGAIQVETPIMYDLEHPSLKDYLNRFPARQYAIQTPNKKVFLRFSACFGQFLMAKDSSISYRDMPLKIYELAKSFRVEQRGELSGLRRLRAFTMPDCHALCSDLEEAKKEMLLRFQLSQKILNDIGFSIPENFELAIRVTKKFWKENKSHLLNLIKIWKKPALIEIWDQQFFYFSTKYELNFIDNLDKASALTTDQIDIENASRYDIKFTTKNDKKKFPLILHLSPSGAIERVIYALLEKAAMEEKDKKIPVLPYWLSPIQARIIPISEKFLKEAINITEDMNSQGIRTDVDDRPLHVRKKILDAELEWVPYIIAIGKKELDTQILSVRIRKEKRVEQIKPHNFKEILKKEQGEMPWKPLPVSILLSKRPKFI